MPSSVPTAAILGRIRERVSKHGWTATAAYILGTGLLEKTGISIMRVYVSGPGAHIGGPLPDGILKSMDDLREDDYRDLRAYGGDALIQNFRQSFDRGYWCIVRRVDARIGCVCWLTKSEAYTPAGRRPATIVQNCFTLPQFRGKSLYSATLRDTLVCAARLWNDTRVFIESSVFNESSIRGIQKAGFTLYGTSVYGRGRCWFRKANGQTSG
jgi:hypothetical protein